MLCRPVRVYEKMHKKGICAVLFFFFLEQFLKKYCSGPSVKKTEQHLYIKLGLIN